MKATVSNKRWPTFIALVVLILASFILYACGGSGGGSTTTTGLSSGTIEGFGSVIVNGIKFDVEGAEVETEHGKTTVIDSTSQEDLLHIGMHVEVEADFNDDGQTGTASKILINDELEGVVTSASVTGENIRTFTVLGQNVIAVKGDTLVFDENTPLGNPTIDDIAVSDFIEVHGFPDGKGNIQASFIKIEDLTNPSDDNEPEITGVIDNNGTFVANVSFAINGQQINYTDAVVDFPPLQRGMLVEVKGALNPADELDATKIHVEDGLGDNIAKIEIEGLILDLDTEADTFTLNGQAVQYSASTKFYGITDPANPEADLANGLKVEAEGPVVNKVLLATKLKLKDSFRYKGQVTDNLNNTLSIIVPGGGTLTIVIDSAVTKVKGVIDYTKDVKIRARQISGSTLLATRIKENGSGSTRQSFETPVVVVNDPIIELLDNGSGANGLISFDTTIDADLEATDFEIDEKSVPRATFMANLDSGDTVKVGFDNGNEDKIEIELDD